MKMTRTIARMTDAIGDLAMAGGHTHGSNSRFRSWAENQRFLITVAAIIIVQVFESPQFKE
jgi:hypothetical protein